MLSVRKKLLMAAGAARKQEVLKMIENSLARIGLSANSAKVYLACIGLGTVPVMRVVEQANLPKATVYDALERLKSEGLIEISSAVRNRTATAVDPSVLLELHESRRQRLQETVPLLKALYHRAQGKPNIRFYEGPEGVDTVLWDSLLGDSTELLSCFSMEELAAYPGIDRVGEYMAERVRLGKHLRVVRSKAKDLFPIWPTSHSEMREVRYTPPDIVLAMTFIIYGNSVALLSSGKEGYGLVIDSEEYASLMRSMFTGIWQMSEPTPMVDTSPKPSLSLESNIP